MQKYCSYTEAYERGWYFAASGDRKHSQWVRGRMLYSSAKGTAHQVFARGFWAFRNRRID